jgi:hypothetical protein
MTHRQARSNHNHHTHASGSTAKKTLATARKTRDESSPEKKKILAFRSCLLNEKRRKKLKRRAVCYRFSSSKLVKQNLNELKFVSVYFRRRELRRKQVFSGKLRWECRESRISSPPCRDLHPSRSTRLAQAFVTNLTARLALVCMQICDY